MVIIADNTILDGELRLSKKWGVKAIIREFPNKNWNSSTLKICWQKLDKQEKCDAIPGKVEEELCMYLTLYIQ